MTLTEAKEKFEGGTFDVSWGPLDRPLRKGETVPMNTTNIAVKEVFENCYGEILFLTEDKLFMPFDVRRLICR